MPTPFTHLLTAQHLLTDPAVPVDQRALLNAERSAYLLGSVVADAQALAGLKREDTHFYHYEHPITDPPWRVMMTRYPVLQTAHDPAWRAFLAGYVMHISMDVVWSLQMTGSHFADREWAARQQRFLMLHVLLISMDERDLALLDPVLSVDLNHVEPRNWLPFMSDAVLCEWGSLIDRQIKPGGVSETLEIYGARVKKTPDELRAILDSPERMESDLWANVPRDLLAQVETAMTNQAREQMITYLNGA